MGVYPILMRSSRAHFGWFGNVSLTNPLTGMPNRTPIWIPIVLIATQRWLTFGPTCCHTTVKRTGQDKP